MEEELHHKADNEVEKEAQPNVLGVENGTDESEGEKTNKDNNQIEPVVDQPFVGASGTSESEGEITRRNKEKEVIEENPSEGDWETPSRKHTFKPASPMGRGKGEE
ncbi:hypothetical protein FRX31_015447 [Thalictrum thalictroides]|uniref:Uncharacterized protein n=1 Tax=Thalictrum thalictroides TaxID=46969 RepID=A0A7J6WC01_THATH|nr:hypothetical protein FRX31_015447 [Thalictrum thalictroides]